MGIPLKSLYNKALMKVCGKRIVAVDDGSNLSNLCNELYPQVLQEVLFEHTWTSAIKRAKLVKLSDAPLFKWANAFNIPNDYVRLINAYTDEDGNDFDFEWVIEGRKLLTNEETVYIKYIATPSTPEIMNPALTSAVVHKLAIALAFPLQAEGSREEQLIVQYESNVLPRAKALDSMESRYLEYEESPWIESLYKDSP